MNQTPPVDSKGAAIDELDNIMSLLVTRIKGDYVNHKAVEQAQQAILAILAQEVKKARIDELTLINSRFSTVRGAPKHKEMIEGYMLARDEFSRVKRERIEELERLG